MRGEGPERADRSSLTCVCNRTFSTATSARGRTGPDTRIQGTTKRQAAALFVEEKPALLPLHSGPFRYTTSSATSGLTPTVALDNFLSTFSGTHFVTPRAIRFWLARCSRNQGDGGAARIPHRIPRQLGQGAGKRRCPLCAVPSSHARAGPSDTIITERSTTTCRRRPRLRQGNCAACGSCRPPSYFNQIVIAGDFTVPTVSSTAASPGPQNRTGHARIDLHHAHHLRSAARTGSPHPPRQSSGRPAAAYVDRAPCGLAWDVRAVRLTLRRSHKTSSRCKRAGAPTPALHPPVRIGRQRQQRRRRRRYRYTRHSHQPSPVRTSTVTVALPATAYGTCTLT